MRKLIVAEVRKLASTRSPYWLMAGVVAMSIVAVLSTAGQSAEEIAKPFAEQQFVFLGTLSKLLIVVIGIRMVTDEWRFGTIAATLLIEPRRGRVIAAKSVVAAGAGIVAASLGQAALLGSAAVAFAGTGFAMPLTEVAPGIAGAIVAGGLWAALGVGLGAVIRNQVTAIVAALVWLAVAEEMIRPWLSELGGYLPGQAGLALALWTSPTTAMRGAAAFVSWALVAVALGGAVTLRRDVT